MLRSTAGIRQAVRWGAFGLVTVTLVTAFGNEPADARRRHRSHGAHAERHVERYVPPYSSIVVDVNSGATLEADSADSLRHPASLTKIMTLYLLFERLEAGKIKLNTPLEVSAHAAAQAPSKLGIKPGDTITVENAIRAIVTKSANDVAVIVAEALGGSELEFARMMTHKAHALGMMHTNYQNASGLPDEEQLTTARDMVVLGRAIQDRFPNYYRYFSTRIFEYRGQAMRNHNKLLGAVAGVDGIKTGYTNASGFNLITSVRRGNRHIVAAVFGGRTGNWRDGRMRGLIDKYFELASTKRTAPMLAEGKIEQPNTETPAKEQVVASGGPLVRVASATPTVSGPAPGSTDPIKPNAVKTVIVKSASLRGRSLANIPDPNQRLMPAPAISKAATVMTVATVKSASAPEALPPPPPGARPGVLGVLPARGEMQVASAGDTVPLPAAVSKPRGAYIIQVGAFDDETDAKERLNVAQHQAQDILGQADPFTERANKGDKTLYRARFAGLDKEQAEAACKNLRRGEIPCMLLKN
jgi:D-alanyl-D-alanine carboxypeptidase